MYYIRELYSGMEIFKFDKIRPVPDDQKEKWGFSVPVYMIKPQLVYCHVNNRTIKTRVIKTNVIGKKGVIQDEQELIKVIFTFYGPEEED